MRMSIENLYSSPLPMRELRDSSKPHINPSVLVIVIILSVVFLCSGILHILARCLGRRRAREPPQLSGSSPSNSIRGQLQHLFSLHDSGVEQVFIDTLPVFLYGSIRGLKDSADCAVCLNEFANEDKLRLLPKCKHAFHTECIDTWLLSNSTCPLCRRSLLPELDPVVTPCAPPPEEPTQPAHGSSFRGSFRASLRGSFRFLAETVAPPAPAPAPAMNHPELLPETPPMTPGPTVLVPQPDGSERTLRVELGKVNVESRPNDAGTSRMARSYSMGSYEYVVVSAPTHRTALSDGIPELSSASHTPGQEDIFWASRGLDTPHSLSRVREIMTPSPGWNLKQKQQQDDGEEIKVVTRETSPSNHGEEIKVVTRETSPSNHGEEIKVVTSSPNPSNPNSEMVIGVSPTPEEEEEEVGHLERSLSLTLLRSPTQEVGSAARMDKVWEVSVDVSEPSVDSRSPSSRKSSPLNWLRGRGRRLVYSAASPSATEMQQQVKENPT